MFNYEKDRKWLAKYSVVCTLRQREIYERRDYYILRVKTFVMI